MDFDIIIDSHTHWGPSVTLGTDVTTRELQRQQEDTGITHVVIMPFPSTAIENNEINVRLLNESKKIADFIPYHYIRENYDEAGFDPIPAPYYGGKWHWMRGWQDSSSDYKVLNDKDLPGLVEKIRKIGKPVSPTSACLEDTRETSCRASRTKRPSVLIPPLLHRI